jgi:integrase/recombinase XerD
MVSACTDGCLGSRNRAAIVLMARAGLRVAELVKVRAADVDVVGGSVRVLAGKGGTARTVGLGVDSARVVGEWVQRRAARGIGADRPLVCTLKGEPVTTDAVRSLIKRLGAKAGIAKRVHPHGLRHSFAAVAGRQLPVVYVQAALGHRHLSSTAVYLASLGGEAVEAVRGLRWD